MPTRSASAVWEGGLKSGKGTFNGASGKIGGSYSFGTRFGEEAGTNPEELLAAAEAACYSMALSLGLEQNGTPPKSVRTTAECTIQPDGGGFTITTMITLEDYGFCKKGEGKDFVKNGRIEIGERMGLPDVLTGYAPNNFQFTSAEFGPASGPSLPGSRTARLRPGRAARGSEVS